jgi:hypothetical protein
MKVVLDTTAALAGATTFVIAPETTKLLIETYDRVVIQTTSLPPGLPPTIVEW